MTEIFNGLIKPTDRVDYIMTHYNISRDNAKLFLFNAENAAVAKMWDQIKLVRNER